MVGHQKIMQTKAIILKRQATKEYDQLITCYTQELGKVIAVAKSSLKDSSIQGRHLDTFNQVSFDVISGRAAPIITGAQSENTFMNIRSSLSLTAAAYFFIEVIDRVAYEHQKDEKLWIFLTTLLSEMDAMHPSQVMPFFRQKQMDFLKVLGYAPEQLASSVPGDSISPLDTAFEYTFGLRLNSLRFLYQVC